MFELRLISWHVPHDQPEVKAIRVRVGRIWHRLTVRDQSWLLGAAEAIVEAEVAKAAWNPKAHRAELRTNREIAIAAAELTKMLRLKFPPARQHPVVRKFISQLVALVEGFVCCTLPVEKETAVHVASRMLERARKRLLLRTGRSHFELIAELVWLASGMRHRMSERSIRRYLEVPPFGESFRWPSR